MPQKGSRFQAHPYGQGGQIPCIVAGGRLKVLGWGSGGKVLLSERWVGWSRTANPIYHCLVHGTMALLAQDLPALWTRWCTHHTHASLGALAHTLDTGTGGLSLPPTASDWQWSQSQRFFLKPYNSVNMNGMLTEACNENVMATTKMLCKFSGLFRCPLCFHVLTVFSGYI